LTVLEKGFVMKKRYSVERIAARFRVLAPRAFALGQVDNDIRDDDSDETSRPTTVTPDAHQNVQ
jgi:hypothetical protein